MQTYTYDSQGRLVLAAPTAKTITAPVAAPVKRPSRNHGAGGRPRRSIDMRAARELRDHGQSYQKIAKALGVPYETLRSRFVE